MVIITPFQGVEPGSIPGVRIFLRTRMAEWLRHVTSDHTNVGSNPTPCNLRFHSENTI